MKIGYNELVGLQANFSRVTAKYCVTHYYMRSIDGETEQSSFVRGYDLCRYVPVDTIAGSLRNAYASVILSVWRKLTLTCWTEFLQFKDGCTPDDLGLPGTWDHWAEL